MYKQIFDSVVNQIRNDMIIRVADNAYIPFVEENADYQTFKKDLAEGASLKDVEGKDMTTKQITTFLRTLA